MSEFLKFPFIYLCIDNYIHLLNLIAISIKDLLHIPGRSFCSGLTAQLVERKAGGPIVPGSIRIQFMTILFFPMNCLQDMRLRHEHGHSFCQLWAVKLKIQESLVRSQVLPNSFTNICSVDFVLDLVVLIELPAVFEKYFTRKF